MFFFVVFFLQVFPIILSKLGPDPKSDNTPNQFILNQIEVCVTQMMEALAAHVDGTDHISHLWPILLVSVYVTYDIREMTY